MILKIVKNRINSF